MSFLKDVVFINENNLVGWEGLKNKLTNQYVDDATVTAQLQTVGGTPIGSAVTCGHIASSNGTYIGVLGKTVASSSNLTEGTEYDIVYSANSGDGTRKVRVVARYQGKR